MASRLRALAVGMTIAATMMKAVGTAAAHPIEPLTLELAVFDHVRVPETVWTRAKAEAGRIYRSLGINLVWSSAALPSVRTRIVLKIVSRPLEEAVALPHALALKSVNSRVLGIAPGHKGRSELVVWAFYERILDFTTIFGLSGLEPGHLLGHVIAHELGHLLLPYDSHSQSGLMRAGWDKSQAANAVIGNLTFNREESALIRRSVARIVADQRDNSTPMTVTRTPN